MPRWLPWPERFWVNVQRAPDGCWNWQGCINQHGYGHIWHGCRKNGRRLTASRVSYELEYGEIPSDLFVLHHCDNRRCVRPDHLFLGTAKDNTRDMMAKGRDKMSCPEFKSRGERHHAHKLTGEQVTAIRHRLAEGHSARSIARDSGVTKQNVLAIKHRRTWTHVA